MAKSIDDLVMMRDRLVNVTSYIEQFRDAVDFLLHGQNDYKDMLGEIPKLKSERDELLSQIVGLTKDIVDSKHAHGELMRKQMEFAQKDQAELKGKSDILRAGIENMESTHKTRMAEIRMEHEKALSDYKAKIDEAQKQLDTIRGGIAAAKAAILKV